MSSRRTGENRNRFRETHAGEVMPREQFMRAEDPRGVADEALLAILLRTGTRGCDVLELARRLVEAFELGRRRQRLSPGDLREKRIDGADAAHALFRSSLTVDDEQENAWVLALDADRRAVCEPFLVSRGTADATLMHPREVFKQALRWGAHSVWVAHNHPSGNPNPGPKDLARTRELAKVSALVGIPLRDHLVLGSPDSAGGRGYVSIRTLRPDLFRE